MVTEVDSIHRLMSNARSLLRCGGPSNQKGISGRKTDEPAQRQQSMAVLVHQWAPPGMKSQHQTNVTIPFSLCFVTSLTGIVVLDEAWSELPRASRATRTDLQVFLHLERGTGRH